MTFATVNGTSYNTLQDLQRAWNEQAYLAANPDVAGLYSSGSSYMTPGTEDYAWANAYGAPGLTHYLTAGMNEGRGGTFLDPTQKQTYQYATIGPNDPNYANYQQALAYDNGQLVLNSRDANGDAHLTANPTTATPLWQQGSTAATIDNNGGLAGGGASTLDKTPTTNAWLNFINNWNSYASNTPGGAALGGVKMSDILASQNLANQAAGVAPLAASTGLSALTGQAQTLGGYQAYGGNFDHYGEGPEHDFFGDQFIDLPSLQHASGLPNATTDQNLANAATAGTINAAGANPGALTAGAISNNVSGAISGMPYFPSPTTMADGSPIPVSTTEIPGGSLGAGGTAWADLGRLGQMGVGAAGNAVAPGIGTLFSLFMNASNTIANNGTLGQQGVTTSDWDKLTSALGWGNLNGSLADAMNAYGKQYSGAANLGALGQLGPLPTGYTVSPSGQVVGPDGQITSPEGAMAAAGVGFGNMSQPVDTQISAPVPVAPVTMEPLPAPLPPSYGGAGGCFITTAICDYLGKPDDCDELQTMRWLRDNVLAKSEKGRADIEDYYATAPGIVAALGDSPEVYAVLREQYLTPCIEATKAGEHDKAWSIYLDMVEEAKRAAQ